MTVPTTLVSHRRRVVSGAGGIATLRDELALAGMTRAVLVCGPTVSAGPVGAAVRHAAGDVLISTFKSAPNAPLASVDVLVELARSVHADGFVSVGGGSAHDTAKGASAAIGAGGPLIGYATTFTSPDRLDVPVLDGPRLPVIAVPTTLSAAEATVSAGFQDPANRHKVVIVDRSSPVRAVILDPVLAAHTPRAVLAASAGNAMNHCVETICSRGHTPLSDAYAGAALRLIATSIDAALDGDLDALESCQAAAYLSGLGLPSAGLGVAHAVCHVLGVFGASHGAANSVMVGWALRFNAGYIDDRVPLVETALGAAPGYAAETITALLDRIGAPTSLRNVGVDKDDLPMIAARALHDRHMAANPRPTHDVDVVEQLLLEAW